MHTEAQLCIPLDKRKNTSQMDQKLSLEALWLGFNYFKYVCGHLSYVCVQERASEGDVPVRPLLSVPQATDCG